MESETANIKKAASDKNKTAEAEIVKKTDAPFGAADLAIVAAVSLASMSGEYCLLPLAVLFPAVWLKSRTRIKGGLLALVYYAVALRELPFGISVYLGSETFWKPAGIFFALVFILSAPYFLIWSESFKKRMLFISIILFILTVPPLGIIGFANPFFAAGAIFPGSKWFGLLLTLALIFLLTIARSRIQLLGLGAFLMLATLCFNSESEKNIFGFKNIIERKTLRGWEAVNTDFKFTAGKRSAKREYSRQLALIRRAEKTVRKKSVKVVLLPETAFGKWNAGTRKLWRNAAKSGRFKNRTIIGGGEIWDKKKKEYENALIQVSPRQKVLYVQKVPIPWSLESVKTAWKRSGKNSAVELAGKKALPLICYESYIMYPFLEGTLFNSKTKVLAVLGNQWWSERTHKNLQKAFTRSLSQLFSLPSVVAVNGKTEKIWFKRLRVPKMKWYTKIMVGIALFMTARRVVPWLVMTVMGFIVFGTVQTGRWFFRQLPKKF